MGIINFKKSKQKREKITFDLLITIISELFFLNSNNIINYKIQDDIQIIIKNKYK